MKRILLMVLLVVGCASPTKPLESFDGTWSGTWAEQQQFSMVVVGDTLVTGQASGVTAGRTYSLVWSGVVDVDGSVWAKGYAAWLHAAGDTTMYALSVCGELGRDRRATGTLNIHNPYFPDLDVRICPWTARMVHP